LSPPIPAPVDVPLCVDLDGTLIHSDLLWESFASVLRTRPWRLLLAPWWLMHGRARLKQELAEGTTIDVARLPYNDALLAFLRLEKARGRKILLVTASDRRLAQAVAGHVGLFDEVRGSDGVRNLRAERKAAALVERFGEKGYDYAGNSPPDLPVWARARAAVVVNAPASLAQRARESFPVAGEFPGPDGTGPRAWWRLLRPPQWVKNSVVFVPLVTARQITERGTFVSAFFALIAFCLGAAAVYVVSAILDLESDRRHATKRDRPLAAGRLLLSEALIAASLLVAASMLVGGLASRDLVVVLSLYFALAAVYSWRLEAPLRLDLIALAGLNALRVVGGYAATGIDYAGWVLAASSVVFSVLAAVRRLEP
jgi:phosphoserine phosphatase